MFAWIAHTHTIKAAILARGMFKCHNVKDINEFLSQTFYIGQCSTINKYYVLNLKKKIASKENFL